VVEIATFMKKTSIYIRSKVRDEKALPIIAGAMAAFDEFGAEVLGRSFSADNIPRDLPDPSNFVLEGNLSLLHYRAALWELYTRAPGKSIFTLDLVENPLVTHDNRVVRASSMQLLDLNTGAVVSPNYASVILSTTPLFLRQEEEQRTQARAYLLGLHELGHLVLGNQNPCADNSCLNSHPLEEDRESLLEEKVDIVLSTNHAPICPSCQLVLKGFQKQTHENKT